MKQYRTKAIILARTNYGEADRIITFLTQDHGKVKAIAKGVRKTKSKLAGGMELFSVSDISFIPGKREIDTIISTRLIIHYGQIVKDIERTNLGYAFIKRLNKATEDATESAYFELLQSAFEALNDYKLDLDLINLWFNMQLLSLAGHSPDLHTDTNKRKLSAGKHYVFDFEKMHFAPDKQGGFSAEHIKFLRLGFSHNSARVLNRVSQAEKYTATLQPIVQSMLQAYIRL